MSVGIKIENLSKIYRLGEIGTGTISRDIERWWKMKVMGREDPFLKIGETNDRSRKGESDVVFSLRDINFEIQQGDAVGIIGRNGAGKSTLLKILSRVTSPTTGKISIKGRVASLLEVGTGFHPELTGRENIYLNGAILGMRKKEISNKLDEIIDFSGVERYIDTPVKRYSSGMYVRLAFAVAAHLESEILIVDEVLAVGDAEFQKKCLGKMGDVSRSEGRTVLFVSHNLGSIKSLCQKGILLVNGNLELYSKTNEVIEKYVNTQFSDSGIYQVNQKTKFPIEFKQIILSNPNNKPTSEFNFGEDITVEIHLEAKQDILEPNFWIMLHHENAPITGATNMLDGLRIQRINKGKNIVRCTFKKVILMPDKTYSVHIGVRDSGGAHMIAASDDVASFRITSDLIDIGFDPKLSESVGKDFTAPLIPYEWEFEGGTKYIFNADKYVR